MRKNEIKFWLWFFAINFSLFLPIFLIDFDKSSFFPTADFLHGTFSDRFVHLFSRNNYDIFRLNVDLAVLLLLFYLFRKKWSTVKYSYVIGVYYVLTVMFLIYYNLIVKIYLSGPVFYNDLYFFKLGFYNIGGSLVNGIIALALICVVIYFIAKAFRYILRLLQGITFGKYSKYFLYTIGTLFLINTFRSGTTFLPEHVFQETSLLFIDNLKLSFEAYRSHKKLVSLKVVNDYSGYELKRKPNIYVLFFESYGKIVYTNPELVRPYLNCISECEKSLLKNGWYIASDFSKSPISGGGSWKSFATFMLGVKVSNQGTFQYFLKYPELTAFSNFFEFFHRKGYYNYRLNSLPENPNLIVSWDNLTRFYAVDKWILNRDLNYSGPCYGMGPAPPDQYALSFAGKYISDNQKGPFTLFFINQNSHAPFYGPHSVATNWQTLNDSSNVSGQSSHLFKRPDLTNYSKIINYEMQMFTLFINQFGKQNDIFILVGDHQPPVLTRHKDGFETPIHIFCKDSTFVRGFNAYGFNPGLQISPAHKSITHEGIYSMFMREFLRNYGTDTLHLPKYMPYGLF